MSRDITTIFRGYAPDERGRDHPPELVYETVPPKLTLSQFAADMVTISVQVFIKGAPLMLIIALAIRWIEAH